MFKSVKSNKISEHIVEQIRKAIFDGQLKPGDKLPPEKELMKNFNVSKVTLREAMRSLEVLGFLEIRKGVSGGAFVTEVDLKTARNSFMNFLHFKNLSLNDLTEVRLLLESHIAEKAALTITEDDLKSLKKLIGCWRRSYTSRSAVDHDIPTNCASCSSFPPDQRRIEFNYFWYALLHLLSIIAKTSVSLKKCNRPRLSS